MRFTLGRKLGMGFGVILTLMAVSTVFSYVKLEDVKEGEDKVTGLSVPTIAALKDLQRDLNQTQSKGRQVVLAGSEPDRREAAKRTFDSNWDEIGKDVAKLDDLSAHWAQPANRDRLAEAKKELRVLREAQEAAMAHAVGGGGAVTQAGNEFADTATPATEAIKKSLGYAADSNEELLQEETEQMKSATQSAGRMTALITFAALAIGIFIAVFLSRRISAATQSVLALAEAIAAGDLTRGDVEALSEDELGDLAHAINKVNDSLRTMILAITDNAQRVASASQELSVTSQQISANSEETSAQAGTVSQATQHVSQNLQSVSKGAEEMTSTIQSIADNTHEAATVASSAVKTAQDANAIVAKLGVSSGEIGEVIKVITSIAQQTNLLALNATIEAARAGEAGKGFAVVANEVKELAKQTAKATEDISRKITAIQTDTYNAVEAIGAVSGVISQISDISVTIATAVEEQSATTNEMTRNVGDAAKGSGEITQHIEGVAEAARGTSASAQESQKAASELAEMALQLHSLVGQFKLDESTEIGDVSSARAPFKGMAAHAGR
ncbi:MAG TPA: methyl-accepting chemotaxis protein [Candidatus Binatus sp.]|nr:methyl-accepting chemotaxis protein [Candidatus Binatus sp.]